MELTLTKSKENDVSTIPQEIFDYLSKPESERVAQSSPQFIMTSGGSIPEPNPELDSKRYWNLEDPRKIGLKNGLRQLTVAQLERVINYKGEMCLDSWNYHEGKFCPLAIGLGLDRSFEKPTHEMVHGRLLLLGYNVYNTRGIEGEFYTTNRAEDLLLAAKEVLQEKLDATTK